MGKQQQVKDIPYHAREDSKPFTYGIPSALNGDTPISPSIHRRNWKQAASQQAASSELESPSLVRKLSSSDAPPGDFFFKPDSGAVSVLEIRSNSAVGRVDVDPKDFL